MADYLLKEDGDKLLLETGDGILLQPQTFTVSLSLAWLGALAQLSGAQTLGVHSASRIAGVSSQASAQTASAYTLDRQAAISEVGLGSALASETLALIHTLATLGVSQAGGAYTLGQLHLQNLPPLAGKNQDFGEAFAPLRPCFWPFLGNAITKSDKCDCPSRTVA